MNIGAESPTEYGYYFAWEETDGRKYNGSEWKNVLSGEKKDFDWANTPFNGGNKNYNEGFFDGVKDTMCPGGILSLEYDAANAHWGGAWRMPTAEELENLSNVNTSWDDTNKGGNYGSGSGVIFLPAAGCGDGSGLVPAGLYGYYWSSTLGDSDALDKSKILQIDSNLYIYDSDLYIYGQKRCFGFTIRAIVGDTTPTPEPFNPGYLCFTAEEAGATVGMAISGTPSTVPSLEYSTDLRSWSDFTIGSTTVSLANIGDKVYFRNTATADSFSESAGYAYFVLTKKVAASGNVMSLLDKTCQATAVPEYAFKLLFIGCTTLTAAPALPATILAPSCYQRMFDRCTSLTAAPALPATILAPSCYNGMFQGCKSLTYVKCLAFFINPGNNLKDWLNDVASSGTFVKNRSMNNWPSGTSGIPDGWTVENAD